MKLKRTGLAVLVGLASLISPASGTGLQIRFSSGIGRFKPTEVNTSVIGWAEQFKRIAGFYSTWSFVSQDIRPLEQNVAFEGELLFSLSRWFALGLSGGYRYGAVQEKDAILTIVSDNVTNNWVKPSNISAYPVIASAYLFLPLGSKLSAYLRAGAGLLYAKFVAREGLKEVSAAKYSYPVFETASARRPAYVGGLGFSYNFDPAFGFFIEADYLSGKADGFTGVDTQKNAGQLYYYEEYFSYLDYWQTKMRVLAAEPSGPNFRSVREAAVDFSGASARIGVLLKF